jgi:cytochrome d ubiquinol oxidase subunit II
MDLNGIWFVLFGVLIIGYAILDGFDLGVGALTLLARSPEDRRQHMDAIAPVWDGNEVWLLTGGGALFAAFPIVYATVFSAFYLALMLLLVFLILRAVSLEYRARAVTDAGRRAWDLAFGLGSLGPALLFGVAVGNILGGLPIDETGTFRGSFLGLLNPYALLVGLTSLAMFLTHGAIYLAMKTDGSVHDRAVSLVPGLWIAWAALWVVASGATAFVAPHLFAGLLGEPVFWPVFLLAVASLVLVPVAARAGRWGWAFLASSAAIGSATGLAGISLWPWLVPSSTSLLYSLDVYNASSTPLTLTVMLVIALIGVPIMLIYTAFIYRVFRGKVQAGQGYH